MAPEIRIELILTDSKSAVLPLHNSGIKSIQNVKEHIVMVDAKTKNPRFFRSRVLCLTLRLNFQVFSPSQNPQACALISLQFERYSGVNCIGDFIEQTNTFFSKKFLTCLQYISIYATCQAFSSFVVKIQQLFPTYIFPQNHIIRI